MTETMTNAEQIASQPAFPACNEANVNGTMGMTLRDWFAGQALVGCIMDRASWGVNHSDKAENFARYAYDIADAMLAVREILRRQA